jgi:DNA-binding GntR family transcriptional regulator
MTREASYAAIRQAITTGRLRPGQRLVEAEMCEMFSVSRGSLRLILARLENDALVEVRPYRGAQVRRIAAPEALEILQARAALEGYAARCAAQCAVEDDTAKLRRIIDDAAGHLARGDLEAAEAADEDLHDAILSISGHATIGRHAHALGAQLVRAQFPTILRPGRAQRSACEHEEIVGAIARGQPDQAETAVRRHLREVGVELQQLGSRSDLKAFDWRGRW